jgi:hypothetical protein
VEVARTILEEIPPASIRAVCYRLFTMGLIDSMSKSETNRVSTQLTWARETGVIPWAGVVDETQEAERISAWDDPAAYVETVKRAYRRDRWSDQPDWIKVWSEKGTNRGTLRPVLEEYGPHVPRDARLRVRHRTAPGGRRERGIDLADVSAVLGHRQITTTRRHYAPVLVSRLKRASERLAGRFDGGRSRTGRSRGIPNGRDRHRGGGDHWPDSLREITGHGNALTG